MLKFCLFNPGCLLRWLCTIYQSEPDLLYPGNMTLIRTHDLTIRNSMRSTLIFTKAPSTPHNVLPDTILKHGVWNFQLKAEITALQRLHIYSSVASKSKSKSKWDDCATFIIYKVRNLFPNCPNFEEGVNCFPASCLASLSLVLLLYLYLFQSICLSRYMFFYMVCVYHSIYLSTYVSFYLHVYQPVCLSVYLPTYRAPTYFHCLVNSLSIVVYYPCFFLCQSDLPLCPVRHLYLISHHYSTEMGLLTSRPMLACFFLSFFLFPSILLFLFWKTKNSGELFLGPKMRRQLFCTSVKRL